MEKDLRDAYKALKLMRADLTRTKKEKQALEHQLSAFAQQLEDHSSHNNSNRNATPVTESSALRTAERALMQQEDARAQLVRLQTAYSTLQQEHEALKSEMATALNPLEDDDDDDAYERRDSTAAAFAFYSKAEATSERNGNYRSNQDDESEFTVETEPIGSSNNGDEELQNQYQKLKHEPQKQQHEHEETAAVVEEMVREKLGLLANLYTLTTKLDEQASEMLAQQAAFAHERDELCMQLEELSEQMVALQAHAMDTENEKKFIEEKYDFLVTELQLIKQTREDTSSSVEGAEARHFQAAALGHEVIDPDNELVAENDRPVLETKLRELEAIREQLEAERSGLRLQQHHEPQPNSVVEDSGDIEAVKSKFEGRIEGLIQTNAILQQQLAEKDEQLDALNASLTQERKSMDQEKLADVQRECDSLRLSLEDAKKQQNHLKQSENGNKPRDSNEILIANLEKERTRLQTSLREASDKVIEMGDARSNASASLLRLEEELRVVKSEKSDLLAANETLERDVEALKRERDSNSSEYERRLDTVSQTILILQQQLQEKELEIVVTKDEMKRQVATCREELATAVQEREHAPEELRGALKELEQREAELVHRSDQVIQLESHAREQDQALEKLTEQFQQQQQVAERLDQEMAKLNKTVLEKDKSLDLLLSEADSLREQIHALGVELVGSRETVNQLQKEKRILEQQIQELQGKLQHKIKALMHSNKQQMTALEHEFQAQEAEKLTSQQTQHEKALKGLAMEIKAFLHEVRQLKQSLKLKEDELVASQSAADSAKTELIVLKDEHERANSLAAKARDLLQYRLSLLETQLMEIEDKKRSGDEDAYDDFAIVDSSDVNARAWAFIKQKVRALDRFLPQLQSFAFFLDTTLCLCEANASTLEALSVQHVGGGTLTQEIVSFLRFVSQLQRGVGATSHVKQGRRVHRQVLELLANWFECSENDDIPAPPFGIASREASLVLHNWTADKSKRIAAKRWLERMESVTTGVSSSEERESLVAEGSTLELQQMTMEVKQAFLMLIVPILNRNPAIYVRVFTRRAILTSTTTPTGTEEQDDANWEMKIHVQLADTLLRRRSSSGALSSSRGAQTTASSPQFRTRPPPLKLASTCQGEPEDQPISTPTSAQKLQIIQERLQRMQSR